LKKTLGRTWDAQWERVFLIRTFVLFLLLFFLSLFLSLLFLVELPSLFWDILIRGSKKEYLELFFASNGKKMNGNNIYFLEFTPRVGVE
jgi:hypothetical protein